MASLNSVILIGNLTRDPELRFTPNKTAVCEFGLAINRKWKDQSGEMKEEVTFVDVTAWGRTGEVVNQYCRKGSPLCVQGRLTLDQWEDKNGGGKRSKLKVTAEGIQLLSDGGGRQQPQGQTRNQPSSEPATVPGPDTQPTVLGAGRGTTARTI